MPDDVTVLRGVAVADEGRPGVAKLVYLYCLKPQPVQGCVLFYNRGWTVTEAGRAVSVIGEDGSPTQLSIADTLLPALESGLYDNRFCRVSEQDDTGVVTALEPVDTAGVVALGDGAIELANGVTYGYDKSTQFLMTELTPDGEGGYTLSDCGPVSSRYPDLTQVGENGIYASMEAAVLCPEGSNVADYVYILALLH